MPTITRRQFSASFVAVLFGREELPTMTLGFSTYGLPGWTTEKAITLLARAGYDSLELCCNKGTDGAPEKMSSDRRKELRKILAGRHLKLTAIMENLPAVAEDKVHSASVDRLKRAAQLAHDLAPDQPPLIETVLGGGVWEKVRERYRDRVADYGKVIEKSKLILAVKPHRMGAMNLPDHALWILDQLKRPKWLRLVYDFSHFDQRDNLTMAGTVKALAPFTAFVAVKDVEVKDGKTRFLLPGTSGRIDYVKLFRALSDSGYRGDVNCEVSGMIHSRQDYDASFAVRTCRSTLARAMRESGVRRG